MSHASEQAIFASILNKPECVDEIREIVSQRDFAEPWHQMVFGVIEDMTERGIEIDVVTLTTEIEKTGNSPELGYLAQMYQDFSGSHNYKRYAESVLDDARARRLSNVGRSITQIAIEPGDSNEKLSKAMQLFNELDESDDNHSTHVKDIIKSRLQVWDDRLNGVEGSKGLPTGFENIDKRITGLQAPNLIVIGGRPGQGKTVLGMNICDNIAATGKSILVFSLELSCGELADRQMASVGKIPLSLILNGKALEGEHSYKVLPAASKIAGFNMHINDKQGRHISDIRREARVHKRKHGLDLVMVDYLQLIKGDGANRTLEVGNVSRQLKEMAKELDVPVIALAQLNRGSTKQQNKMPGMSDLRDSGEIEQDADIIIFIHREESYNEKTKKIGIAEINFSKFRNGTTGIDQMVNNLSMSRFDSYDGPMIVDDEPEKGGNFKY